MGAVAIGRNEGQRLERCLRSLLSSGGTIVYVDSGSTDSSVSLAESLGVDVVRLDLTVPFTAGRARNAGFARLCELVPELELVQFIDGDCVLDPGWLGAASLFLNENHDVAIACGRRKEMHPEATIYNQLCDLEWNTPVGYARSCGGDFLARRSAFGEAGGFNAGLIAGEEPELCHRLRRKGWRIFRLDRPMTLHDAAIRKFSQWARRSRRSGYAYAARAWLHRRDGTRYCWRENTRIAFWAAVYPLAVLGAGSLLSAWALLLFAIYPVQLIRLKDQLRQVELSVSPMLIAFFQLLGNWTECSGQALFAFRLVTRRRQTIIEYK